MSASFILGKIVSASSQSEAIELFDRRKSLGIGGVIFTPEIVIPDWTDKEKEILSSEFYHAKDLMTKETPAKFLPSTEWQKVAGNIPEQIVSLTRKFNRSGNHFVVNFWNEQDFRQVAHRDKEAKNGWFHFSITGAGMICLNPTGDKPVRLRLADSWGHDILQEDIRYFMDRGEIASLILQENQSLIFDDTMGHMSNEAPGFRALANG